MGALTKKLSGVFLFDHSRFAVRPVNHDVVDFNHPMLGTFCERRRVVALCESQGFVWRFGQHDDAGYGSGKVREFFVSGIDAK